jgi:group I intron endonuclease
MIGIYKITSPSGKVYVGQSIDIKYRFSYYYRYECKNQIRLYNSFLKYGVSNHIFEIIEECEIDFLNNRELFWQKHYDTINEKGLNCFYTTDENGHREISEKTKLKMSLAQKGRKHSEETRLKISESNKGKIMSEESKIKASQTKKGCKGLPGKYNPMAIKIINIETNQTWDTIKDCAEYYNVDSATIPNWIKYKTKNRPILDYFKIITND